jgi:hypothetical protein
MPGSLLLELTALDDITPGASLLYVYRVPGITVEIKLERARCYAKHYAGKSLGSPPSDILLDNAMGLYVLRKMNILGNESFFAEEIDNCMQMHGLTKLFGFVALSGDVRLGALITWCIVFRGAGLKTFEPYFGDVLERLIRERRVEGYGLQHAEIAVAIVNFQRENGRECEPEIAFLESVVHMVKSPDLLGPILHCLGKDAPMVEGPLADHVHLSARIRRAFCLEVCKEAA